MMVYGICTNVWERYEKIGRIGKGTYGIVYKARDRETNNSLVALKRCLPHHAKVDGFPITTLREIRNLRLCAQHSCIVRLHEVAVSASGGVFLVMEYCPHDLAQIVDAFYYGSTTTNNNKRSSPFAEPHVKRLMQQLLLALEFLHTRGIIHRDLKLSNLLYTTEGNLKLADFGLSRRVLSTCTNLQKTPHVVSLWYRPPEILFGGRDYDESIDVWGAGCVMGELLLGHPLSTAKTELEQIRWMMNALGPLPTVQTWPHLADLPLFQHLPTSTKPQRRRDEPQPLLDQFDGLLSIPGLSLLLERLLCYNPSHRWSAASILHEKPLSYFDQAPLPATTMPQFSNL